MRSVAPQRPDRLRFVLRSAPLPTASRSFSSFASPGNTAFPGPWPWAPWAGSSVRSHPPAPEFNRLEEESYSPAERAWLRLPLITRTPADLFRFFQRGLQSQNVGTCGLLVFEISMCAGFNAHPAVLCRVVVESDGRCFQPSLEGAPEISCLPVRLCGLYELCQISAKRRLPRPRVMVPKSRAACSSEVVPLGYGR